MLGTPDQRGCQDTYGVATISRLLQIIGLFCRISSLIYRPLLQKESYNLKEPTNRSHSISSRIFVADCSPKIQILESIYLTNKSDDGVKLLEVANRFKTMCQNKPPKNGLIALWPSTNGAIPYFLLLLSSELSISEITEYTYLGP